MPRYGRIVLTVVIALILAGGGLFALARSEAAPEWLPFTEKKLEWNGGFFDPPKEAHELINAVDQNGEPFTLEQFEGKTVFIYFGYTNCPDYCPATLAGWREVKAELGDDAEDVVFVMVTVDPERDTPERMKEYMNFWDPSFYGVVMSPEDTAKVAEEWGVRYSKRDGGSDSGYLVDHEVSTFVIGPDGMITLMYPLGFDPEGIAADVRQLQDN